MRGRRRTRALRAAGAAAAGALLLASARYVSARTLWPFVWDGPRQAADLLRRMFPPDWTYARDLVGPLLETLHIATLGTLLALAIAGPVAWLAARTTTPHPLFRAPALAAIAVSRSVNSLIWALLLVSIFGPGVLAGVLAIAFRSVGFVGKLLYEAIEEVEPGPLEALTAAGAGRLQVLRFAVVPRIAPVFAGVAWFRWDINIREATVVGLVGAGGVGLALDAAVSALEWARAGMILILILALVLAAETLSARARAAVR
ncbi:MAG: phosphonate ABC transporter, permease protein PhnE [Acidobacteria bacterium]|nr:MAG: phosphonate ABC transporter, permease protein PhnE [Acidobacteriota bacterium]